MHVPLVPLRMCVNINEKNPLCSCRCQHEERRKRVRNLEGRKIKIFAMCRERGEKRKACEVVEQRDVKRRGINTVMESESKAVRGGGAKR